MTARPPTIPTMLKVTPTAALFLKKPEEEAAPAVEEAAIVTVEPPEVVREGPANLDVTEFGELKNAVVGLALLDTAPIDELTNYQLLYKMKKRHQPSDQARRGCRGVRGRRRG